MSLVQVAQDQLKNLMAKAGAPEAEFRRRVWADFERLGLPDRKTETWKYTALTSLDKAVWSEPKWETEIWSQALRLRDRYQEQFDVVVIQNGKWRTEASVLRDKDREVGVNPMKTVAEFEDGFSGLTLAVAEPGIQLTVRGSAKPRRPLLLIHVAQGDGAWAKAYHQVLVSPETQLDLAEVYLGEGRYLRSDITRVEVSERASVNWVRIQDEALASAHFSDLRASVAQNAKLNLAHLNCGGCSWARTTTMADVRGTGAEGHLFGLTFARDQQHVDQRVVANHWSAHSTSSQVFKGVLKDRARAIMNGRIFIAKDAQKVASSQLNQNLILNSGAEANTKPELEIYADDVKANHGASIGRLDEAKLFYLQSRGINKVEALQILAKAFVADILMKIDHPALRRLAEDSVHAVLPEFAREMESGS